MMYTESLITPHPFHGVLNVQPLLSALNPGVNQQRLAEARQLGANQTADALLNIADETSKQVHASLWFAQAGQKVEDEPIYTSPFDSLRETQSTNCYGYTVVLSECLEMSGIEHYIGYTNGHTTTFIPFSNESGGHLYFADALIPSLNQTTDESGAVRTRDIGKIATQIDRNGRAAVIFDTENLCLGSGTPVQQLENKYPWLRFDRSNVKVYSSDKFMGVSEQQEVDRYHSRYLLILSLFPSRVAREMLMNHVAFQQAMHAHDIETACASWQALEGVFPEMDARQRHEDLRQLVEALCETGHPEEAAKHVSSYFSANFSLSTDSRLPEARGDLLRIIARRTGFRTAAALAVESYVEAAARPKAFRQRLAGKIAAAKVLASQHN